MDFEPTDKQGCLKQTVVRFADAEGVPCIQEKTDQLERFPVETFRAMADPATGFEGIPAFTVEKDFPGFSRGRTLTKRGLRGSPTAELVFVGCDVPASNFLGGENRGLKVLTSGLHRERVLYAAPVDVVRGAFDAAFRYVCERKQFGTAVLGCQKIQALVAEMAEDIQAARFPPTGPPRSAIASRGCVRRLPTQALLLSGRHAGCGQGCAGLWRIRVHPGVSCREHVSGRQRDRVRRGDHRKIKSSSS